ncbi:MAG: site-2 protease family protein [Candidatus ainarchaeum sp.]|nr:site-2 protease family protein [Candidatus ainarchaeum sp.]
MSILFYILIFLVVAIIVTYLLKKYANAKTYLIFSIVKSTKLAEKFDKLKFGTVWDKLGDFGISLGFGALGLFYLRKGKNKLITILYVLLFFAAFFLVIYFLAGKSLLDSLLISGIFGLFGFSGIVIYLLIVQTIMLIDLFVAGQAKCVGIAPVIPGVKIPKVPITIPFFEGWIALIIGMVIHEFSHAVLMRKAKVKIKSFGPLLLGFLPIGAFVEPDEKKLKSISLKDKLRIYASGPAINIIFAVIVFGLLLLFGAVTSNYTKTVVANYGEVYIVGADEYGGICGEGGLSKNFGLVDENTKISSVDGNTISSLTDFRTQIISALKDEKQYISAELEKDQNVFDQNLYFNEKNVLGISLEQRYKEGVPFKYKVIGFVSSLLYWIFLLNLLIGIFNFLPVVPFDGGAMAMSMYSPLFFFVKGEKREKTVMMFFIALVVLLLVLNLIPIFG